MTEAALARDLCSFIARSPTPFHAVRQMAKRLEAAGFAHLRDDESWSLQEGGCYYFTRNDSSLVALQVGSASLAANGLRLIGAHTDSPCLKIKPVPEVQKQGFLQLGVEVYGGALLGPWFDRDLSIAGRVSFLDDKGHLQSTLIDFREPVAFIPSLAIHLDREVNQKRSINQQTDLPPVLMQVSDKTQSDFRGLLRAQLLLDEPGLDITTVLDYELCLYDTQVPTLVGLKQEFVAGARLDNLLSCFAGLQALLASSGDGSRLLVCTDHEEVGSGSAAGASGPFLESVLLRVNEALHGGSQDSYRRMLAHSVLASVDNAHAVHPNFAEKHDGKHGPQMNAGPVIKYNSNQRYATNSTTGSLFRKLCADVDVPCQSFVVRSDMGCGSTIGPLVATELGVPTIDIGVPTLGMHSIRELAGSRDIDYLCKVLTHFCSTGVQSL
jgi:aspartyl aminopeptidase